ELEEDAANEPRTHARHDGGERLDRLRVRDRMRERARGTEALGEEQDAVDLRALGRLLDPAVCVEEARLELEYELADPTEAEMPGLDDPGVDGADRHLHDTLTVHPRDGSVRMRLARHSAASVEVFPQRVRPMRPVVMEDQTPRIRMTL